MRNENIHSLPRPGMIIFKTTTFALAIFFSVTAVAEVATDGSLGATVNLTGTQIDISADLGQTAGNNLFHSFDRFSLSTGQTATFSGPDSITNVFNRVTGGSVSTIDGTIQDTFANADFYFINPAGIVIGPNASLNVSGSFFLSTADYLQFSDDIRFVATTPTEDVSLTTAPPQAFGFSNSNIASISIEGSTLTLAENKHLSLVGGDIVISAATIQTQQGNIEIVSRATAGEVVLSDGRLSTDPMDPMGNISINQSQLVSAGLNSGGDIRIQGGQFVADATAIYTYSSGFDKSGDIDIQSSSIKITNGSTLYSGSFMPSDAGSVTLEGNSIHISNSSQVNTTSEYSGNAGSVEINGEELIIDNASQIITYSAFSGEAGNVNFNAQKVTLDNKSLVNTDTYGEGNAGAINISAHNLMMANGSSLSGSSAANGNAAAITINANEIQLENVSRIYTGTSSSGTSGDISINAHNLTLNSGSELRSQSLGAGNAGNISLELANNLSLKGESETGQSSRIIASTGNKVTPGLDSAAGNILINTKNLFASGGTLVLARTYGNGDGGNIEINATGEISLSGASSLGEITGIGTEALPTAEPMIGDAGNIRVTGQNLHLHEGAFLNSSAGVSPTLALGDGDAGNIDITLSGDLQMNGTSLLGETQISSGITALTTNGNGGSITLKAANAILTEGAQIQSVTYGDGNSGDITLSIQETLALSGGNTSSGSLSGIISGASPFGSGDAGDISINAGSLLMSEGAAIWSNTFENGRGGNIHLNIHDSIIMKGNFLDTPAIELKGQGSIIASSTEQGGAAGNILIEAGSMDIEDGARLYSATYGPGNAGDITVSADSIRISGKDKSAANNASAIVSETNGAGSGGAINISGKEVLLENDAQITSKATSTGQSGEINVSASGSITMQDSRIESSSLQSEGGDITLNAITKLWLKNSEITTSAFGGNGNGGNIRIDPEFVILDNSLIRANAFGGRGGNISISAGQLILSPDSTIEAVAKSSKGIDGEILIESPDNNISGDLKRDALDVSKNKIGQNSSCWKNTDHNVISLIVNPPNRIQVNLPQMLRAPTDLGYDNGRLAKQSASNDNAGLIAQNTKFDCAYRL